MVSFGTRGRDLCFLDLFVLTACCCGLPITAGTRAGAKSCFGLSESLQLANHTAWLLFQLAQSAVLRFIIDLGEQSLKSVIREPASLSRPAFACPACLSAGDGAQKYVTTRRAHISFTGLGLLQVEFEGCAFSSVLRGR